VPGGHERLRVQQHSPATAGRFSGEVHRQVDDFAREIGTLAIDRSRLFKSWNFERVIAASDPKNRHQERETDS
jgi:hypothetical protein